MAERLATSMRASSRASARTCCSSPPMPRPSGTTPFGSAVDAAAGGRRADRPRGFDRAARRQRLPAHGRGRRRREYAVRGSLIALFPAGEPTALRLDFFGDEIESCGVRPRRPAHDRPGGRVHLIPGVRSLAREATIKRFRARYRENFAPMPPATRFTRRCPKDGGWPGWSIGCPCSRKRCRRCSST